LHNNRKTEKLDSRIISTFYRVWKRNINKISSSSRLYSRLNALPKSKRTKKATRIDNLLRWRVGLRRGWCNCNNYFTFRHKDEICCKIRISMYK
jgi:hypothetical protein